MDRRIGDISDERIKDAKKLLVYFKNDKKIKIVTENTFPKGRCTICIPRYIKTRQCLKNCKITINSWSKFKDHLKKAERTIGELLAFPPTTSGITTEIYTAQIDFRYFGNVRKYQSAEAEMSFYIFDLEKEDFIRVSKKEFSAQYISNGKCNYCQCDRKILSPSQLFDRISSLERKYFCHLIQDSVATDSDHNRFKIKLLLLDYKRNRLEFDRSTVCSTVTSIKTIEEVLKGLDGDDETNFDAPAAQSTNPEFSFLQMNESLVGEIGTSDISGILTQMKRAISENHKAILDFADKNEKMDNLIKKLEKNLRLTPLIKSIIESQISFDHFKAANDYYSFYRMVDLNINDFRRLLEKSEIEKNIKVSKSKLSLRVSQTICVKQNQANSRADDSDSDSIIEVSSGDLIQNLINEQLSFKYEKAGNQSRSFVKQVKVDVQDFRRLFNHHQIQNKSEVITLDLVLKFKLIPTAPTNAPSLTPTVEHDHTHHSTARSPTVLTRATQSRTNQAASSTNRHEPQTVNQPDYRRDRMPSKSPTVDRTYHSTARSPTISTRATQSRTNQAASSTNRHEPQTVNQLDYRRDRMSSKSPTVEHDRTYHSTARSPTISTRATQSRTNQAASSTNRHEPQTVNQPDYRRDRMPRKSPMGSLENHKRPRFY